MGKAWAPESAAGAACPAKPPRSAAYWAAAMAGQDFAGEDRLDTARYNRALWRGLEGDAPIRRGATAGTCARTGPRCWPPRIGGCS
jgi:hypothetical protein